MSRHQVMGDASCSSPPEKKRRVSTDASPSFPFIGDLPPNSNMTASQDDPGDDLAKLELPQPIPQVLENDPFLPLGLLNDVAEVIPLDAENPPQNPLTANIPDSNAAIDIVPQLTICMTLAYVRLHANDDLNKLLQLFGPLPQGHSSTDVLLAASQAAMQYHSVLGVAKAWKEVSKYRLKWINHDITPILNFDAAECYSSACMEASRVWNVEVEESRKVEDAEKEAERRAELRAELNAELMGMDLVDVKAEKVAAGIDAEKRIGNNVYIREQVEKAKIAVESKNSALGDEKDEVAAILSRHPRPLHKIRHVECIFRTVQYAEDVKRGVNEESKARLKLLYDAKLVSREEKRKVTARKGARLDDVKQDAYKYALEQLHAYQNAHDDFFSEALPGRMGNGSG